MPQIEPQRLLGMDLRGRKFTLGTFQGEVELYLPEKNSFLVRFNGVDLMEVDAATVVNLLVQQESETKNEESAQSGGAKQPSPSIPAPTAQPPTLPSSTPLTPISPGPPSSAQMPPFSNPNAFNFLQNGFRNQNFGSNIGMNLRQMYGNPNLSEVLFPLTNSLQKKSPLNDMNLQNQFGSLNSGMYPNHQPGPPTGYPPPDDTRDPSYIKRLPTTRYQEGMRRHRSTSQPHLVSEVFVKGALAPAKPRQKRRESLIDRRQAENRMANSVHQNVPYNQGPMMGGPRFSEMSQMGDMAFHQAMLRHRMASHASGLPEYGNMPMNMGQPHPSFLPQTLRPQHSPQTRPRKGNNNSSSNSEATKAEIFKIIRGLYQTNEVQGVALPEYSAIEAKLKTPEYINAARLSTLRSRTLIKKTLAPIEKFLPVQSERYIVNSLINVCPICGTSISLNKLGSQINWFKHLTGCHGELGEVIAARFEFFETNQDPKVAHLREFKQEWIDDAVIEKTDRILLFKTVPDRHDIAPIEESKEEIEKHTELIPFTTKCSLETLLLNNLIQEKVFTEDSILLQEIVVFSIREHKLVPLNDLRRLFPKLREFQKQMQNVSEDAFNYYVSAGHPNLLDKTSDESEEAGKNELTLEQLKKKVIEYCSDDAKTSTIDLDWRVLLFNKFLQNERVENSCIMVQEVLVLAFFYFGFITQRTPKKFRIFGKLLEFFGQLYKVSCKCYDIYVGEGPTGAEHTRGKPVNPSKLIIQNYNHYGLSRKSLQRALAKEGRDTAISVTTERRPGTPAMNFGELSLEPTDLSGEQIQPRSGRRGSVKRKNSIDFSQSRRRRSSILNYVPVVTTNSLDTATDEENHLTAQQLGPPSVSPLVAEEKKATEVQRPTIGSPSACAQEVGERLLPSSEPESVG